MDSSVQAKEEMWFLRVCHQLPHELYSLRASIQPTSYADHVPVVSPDEFRSAVACVSVEIIVLRPLVSAPVRIARPNSENSALVLTL